MANLRNVILCDIDHTIANSFWRDPMILEKDWDAYHQAGANDAPVNDMVTLLQELEMRGHFEIIGLTARPEKWRQLTISWMLKHHVPIREVLMRDDNAFRPAPEIKLELARARFGSELKERVAFIIDDRDDIVSAFRAEGITVLQCYARKD